MTTTFRKHAARHVLGTLALAAIALSPAAQAGELDADTLGTVAAGSTLTREQVRADLAAAQRAGTVIVNGETGQTARDLDPARYAGHTAPSALTRQAVRAEAADAIRRGEALEHETGLTFKQLFPRQYAQPVRAGRSAG